MNCKHCNNPLSPAPGKLHATGEQSYVGYFPCPCKRRIYTDCGVVYPGTEEHKIIVENKLYSTNDVLAELF